MYTYDSQRIVSKIYIKFGDSKAGLKCMKRLVWKTTFVGDY